jgi:hypothetical protein
MCENDHCDHDYTCAVRAHAGLFVSRRHRGLRLLLHLLSTAASHAVHLRAGRHVEILEVLEVPCRTTARAVHPVRRLGERVVGVVFLFLQTMSTVYPSIFGSEMGIAGIYPVYVHIFKVFIIQICL